MLQSTLAGLARHGRYVLIAGLVAGALFPGLAVAMRPTIVPLIALLLFLSALRVGPRQMLGARPDLAGPVRIALLYQVALPLAAVLVLLPWSGTPAAAFVVLMLAAAPISGSPSIAVMVGGDPTPAMRQLVVGTALLPLTVLPVFWFVPAFGAPQAVLLAAFKLLGVIVIATVAALVLRETVLRRPSANALEAIDGLSALALALVVIGLMSAIGPALRSDPASVANGVLFVCLVNFGLQVVAAMLTRRFGRPAQATAFGIIAGNRNVALFLTVLPPETIDALLFLIGCYQVPMYLTPLVLGRFYARAQP